MATAITVPDIGTTVTQVRLVRWLKAEGDAVGRGEPLCEMETDKAVSDLESVGEGVVLKVLVAEDTEVEQGVTIAYVGAVGEAIPDAPDAEEPGTGSGAGEPAGESSDRQPAARQQSPQGGDGARAIPAVPPMLRNLAAKLGVDPATVKGTGAGGRLTREDLVRAAEAPPTGDAGRPAGGQPLSENQVVVARRVSRSQHDIPPIDLTARFDMSAILAQRQRLLETADSKVSIDAFLMAAIAGAMKDFPHFRARLEGEAVVDGDDVNVGVALGLGEQLFTPVVPHADRLAVQELDAAIRDRRGRAADGRLIPADLEGATLTISNLGMYPVLAFSAIIPPGQVAIVSVGTIELTPIATNDSIEIISAAQVTLSVDHRLINGREAAEFLTAVKTAAERL